MKILRFKSRNENRIGILSDRKIIPFPSKFGNDIISIITEWDDIKLEIDSYVCDESKKIDLAETELLAPIETPSKFLAIGLNYKKHRQETIDAGITPPRNQMWFTKQTSCINSPYGNIIKPDATMMLDYEVELAFIVGKR